MADLEIKLLTGEDLLEIVASNSGKRYELIEGELIEMVPTGLEHGGIESNASFVIMTYLQTNKIALVLTGEVGFYTRGDDKTVRAADVAVMSHERLQSQGVPSGYGKIPPDLVVEIMSPNDKAEEIDEKIKEWLSFGVRLVWVLYPKTKRVHVHGEQLAVLEADEFLTGGEVLPGFSVKVSEFFAR